MTTYEIRFKSCGMERVVIEELRWLQDTVSSKSEASKNDAKGKTKKGVDFDDGASNDMSIDDVLTVLGDKPKNKKDEKQLVNHGRLRSTITNILKCIHTLSSMVAGAASTFWIKHEEIFEKLDELFERCSAFLGRLHIYRNSMTLHLQLVAYKVLHHVVKIFRHSVDIYQSKRKLLEELLKNGFLGESEIKDLLEKLEQLVRDEQAFLVAESFTQLKEIAKTVADDDAQRRVVADAKVWKSLISASLGLGEEGNELQPESKIALRNIDKALVQGTGKWILDEPKFKAWTGAQSKSPTTANRSSVLALRGEGNTGKSFLAANIIKQFEARTPRPVVGYHFYQRDPKQPFSFSDNKLRSHISRSLLWQFATSRNAPTQSMAQGSAKMGYNPDDIDIWRQLFLDIDPVKRRENEYYIIIDGLEDTDIGSVIPFLCEVVRQGEVRVLLTSKDQVARHFTNEYSLPFMTIELDVAVRPNLADINLFILDRLDSMDALKIKENSLVKTYRENIRKNVEEKTRGDYIWISTILNSLAHADRASEFDDILKKIKTTRANQIADEILRLNRSLSDASIKDLNAIILWVIAAQELPTVTEMNAVLFLNFGSLSFIPLHQRLAPLLELNNVGRINFKSPEIKEIISTEKTETRGRGTAETATSTDTVQRFLEHVCPRKEYELVDLEEFLWGENLSSKDAVICYDDANSHMRIAITCLKCLTKAYNDQSEQLRTYAGNHLLFHLEKTKLPEENQQNQIVTAHADHQLVEEASLLLLKLFTEDEGIDSLFWTRAEHMSQHAWIDGEGEWLKRNRERWLYKSQGVKELARWFSNTIVANIITKTIHKDWVNDFLSDKGRWHEILLQFAAKRLAHHLLLEDIFTSREECTAIYFLYGYVSRVQLEGDLERSPPCLDDRAEMLLSDILRIERWAASEAIFGERAKISAMWQIQTAMTIDSMCANDDKEKVQREQGSRANRALELDPHNLMASSFVARRLKNSIKTEGPPQIPSPIRTKAINILKTATQEVEFSLLRDSNWFDTISRSLLAASIYLDFGDLYWAEGKTSEAAKMYNMNIETWSDVVRFLTTLNTQSKLTHHAQYLDRFIHEFIADSVFQQVVSEAAEKTGSWSEVKKLFTCAFELAKETATELFYAHKAYISIIQRGSNKEATIANVIENGKLAMACGVPQAESGIGVLYRDIFVVVDSLALIYLNKAMVLLHKVDMKAGTALNETTLPGGRRVPITPEKPRMLANTTKPLPELKRFLDEAMTYRQEIEKLQQDTDVWMNTGVCCCLAWYHRKMGDMKAARKVVERVMAAAIALLSDKDPANDWFAVLYLGRALTTLQDWKHAPKAWSILKFLLSDIEEPLLACHVCKKQVNFRPEDKICKICYGPVFVHDKYHRKLPTLGGTSCAQHHDFIKILGNDEQLDPDDVHKWKNALRDYYGLDQSRVNGKDLIPSSLIKRDESKAASARERRVRSTRMNS
ncbi:hypothetical protein N0V90_012560 [Kalmusia sp. IMI 367209]|nr:hypothetical protein N0V90_012560 [Kalmusia sp. IMI 367209]